MGISRCKPSLLFIIFHSQGCKVLQGYHSPHGWNLIYAEPDRNTNVWEAVYKVSFNPLKRRRQISILSSTIKHTVAEIPKLQQDICHKRARYAQEAYVVPSIGSTIQVGSFVSSGLSPPAYDSSPINLCSGKVEDIRSFTNFSTA